MRLWKKRSEKSEKEQPTLSEEEFLRKAFGTRPDTSAASGGLLAGLAESLVATTKASEEPLPPGSFRVKVVGSDFEAHNTVLLGGALGAASDGEVHHVVMFQGGEFAGEDASGVFTSLSDLDKGGILLMTRDTLTMLRANERLWSRVHDVEGE